VSLRSGAARPRRRPPCTGVYRSCNSSPQSDFRVVLSPRRPVRHTQSGGSALVRRRIQTPSDATVLSVVQPEGEVVLGASPLARRLRRRARRAETVAGQSPSTFYGRHRKRCRRGPPLRARQRRAIRAEDCRAGKAGTASMVDIASDVDVARLAPGLAP
jgi:hypothetical protein